MYVYIILYIFLKHVMSGCSSHLTECEREGEGGRGREKERQRERGREREKERERKREREGEREREFTFVVESSSMGCLAFNPLCVFRLMTEKQHQKLITT